MNADKDILERLGRIEEKLDRFTERTVENTTAISWLKWLLGSSIAFVFSIVGYAASRSINNP